MSEAEHANLFDLFDLKKAGALPKAVVWKVIRASGRKYLDSEITAATASMPDPCSKDAFLTFLRTTPYSGPSPDELLVALQTFDGADTGSLRPGELTGLLTTLGEKMEHEPAKRLVDDCTLDEEGGIGVRWLRDYLAEPVPFVSPNIDALMASLPGV